MPANQIIDLLPSEVSVHRNIANTTIVKHAWKKSEKLSIHSLIYNINDGILKDLDTCTMSYEELKKLE